MMLAPPDAALEIASSARLRDSSFATGTRRFARAIRIVFKVAMVPLYLAENGTRHLAAGAEAPLPKSTVRR
jgi:hypothetical protein